MFFKTVDELLAGLGKATRIKGNEVEVVNEKEARGLLVDRLACTASLGDEPVRETARWAIWALSQALGAVSSSIHDLYAAMGRGEVHGYTVPAMNLRGLTYETAQAAFRAAKSMDAGPFIFEIARSEIGYTSQRPWEYTALVLAAAIREGWSLPVFLQGDHFQLNASKYKIDAAKEMGAVKALTEEAMVGGFYNIDIDASTLVDLDKTGLDEQQHLNYGCTAELLEVIRKKQPPGITVSVGGEIGEVGGRNSTLEELRAYLDGLKKKLAEKRIGPSVSKISIQTGTTHGGIPLPDGTVAKVKLDFDTLERLSAAARKEYGLSGAVQHGASTLPDEMFHRFPEKGTSEVHLATGFQNLLLDHEAFPKALRDKIYGYLRDNHGSERKSGQTDEQFFYSIRKKGFGPFKNDLWAMDEKAKTGLGEALEAKIGFLFKELRLPGTSKDLKKHIKPVKVVKPRPSAERKGTDERSQKGVPHGDGGALPGCHDDPGGE